MVLINDLIMAFNKYGNTKDKNNMIVYIVIFRQQKSMTV